MNAPFDVAAIVAGAKNPEVTRIEARLAELQNLDLAVGAEWQRWSEESNPSLTNALNPRTHASREAARLRVKEIEARRADLANESKKLREKKEQLAAASLAAIRDALEPVRDRALQDIKEAVSALYAAIALHNTTSAALNANGAAVRLVPGHLPILDHIVNLAKR